MASIKKKSSGGGGGANWMDTYGDMVTLLLCFFVLLYSISTIDAEKWMIVVRSFNRDALIDTGGPDPNASQSKSIGNDLPATTQVESDLTELYEFLAAYAAASGESGEILVSQGDGYVFLSFADAVFFDPNSSVLRPDGEAMLSGIIPALEQCGRSIDELRVLGHTAQLYQNVDNEPYTDWGLSSARAANVAAYIQSNSDHELLDPGRMTAEGHAQWRAVGDNATTEGMMKNRRVEMIITGRDIDDVLSDSYQQYYTMYNSTQTSN